jgi:hypothetical protein
MIRLDRDGRTIAAALTHGRSLNANGRKIRGKKDDLAEWENMGRTAE